MATSNIGRPKKSKSVDSSEFYNITDTPKRKSSVIEFCSTEPFNMSKYFKTIKSNRIPEFYMSCFHDKVIFWGKSTPKQYTKNTFSDSNNFMYLRYDCTNIFRYYCARQSFINITDKESIINLLGEISESSCKIEIFIDGNFTDKIEFILHNETLKNKSHISVKCDIEFDTPVKIPKIKKYIKNNDDLYCLMSNIDVGEYKKDLSTKFKKKIVDSRIQFMGDVVKVIHRKDVNRTMETTYNTVVGYGNEQSIIVRTKDLIEMNYPKNSIANFLLHIKGKFNILFYKNVIVLMYTENNAQMTFELALDSL